MTIAIAALFGYLLGSIPFGIVITRALGLGDLRSIGSGNIGATNVLRTGHKGAALATLLLDAGKGAVALLIARALGGEGAALAAGSAALAGHLFPVWLGFQGGKGVATFLGLLTALAWPVGLAAALTWLIAAGLTRISSAGGLATALLAPLYVLATSGPIAAITIAALSAAVIWRHRENIARLRTGTEPRIGQKN
ncbi:MAG: glycerol-3-phosphate 1-O-acyltransferase PlsY [Pseudomonadota bacterium]